MEAPEEDAEFLSLSAPVQGVTLRLSQPFDLDNAVGGKAEPGNLLAVSNEFGWVVAARSEGATFGSASTSHDLVGAVMTSLDDSRGCEEEELAAAKPGSSQAYEDKY
ncbi:hypothetical protein JCM10295v2_006908 [Rhodotorula toruloides]